MVEFVLIMGREHKERKNGSRGEFFVIIKHDVEVCISFHESFNSGAG